MKEYGIKESWTKLYNIVPCVGNPNTRPYPKTVYIFDDDIVLFRLYGIENLEYKLFVYNYNNGNGNVKILEIQHMDGPMNQRVYVESLISLPCSY
jgi:hypothetical protein